MKTIGIIGGIGPESTIEYYRFIIEGYREREGDGSYPSIIISVDLNQLIAWMNADELDNAAESRRTNRRRDAVLGDRIRALRGGQLVIAAPQRKISNGLPRSRQKELSLNTLAQADTICA